MPVRFMRIKWPSSSYANTVDFEYPANRPDPKPAWVGERATAPSGVIDTWEEATHEELEAEFTRIPTTDASGITGYNGAAGIKAFFMYAMGGGVFKLYVDRDDEAGTEHVCQLVDGRLERESQKLQTYGLFMRVRDTGGVEFII